MKSQQLKKLGIPDKSGVYFFQKGKDILYIGKATSLRSRVRSYFGKDLIETRGPLILDMVFKSSTVKWQETDSVLEALILEANFIKKHQPYYNTKEKDDKSFNFVCITNESIPKILIVRGKDLSSKKYENFSSTFGPYTNGGQLKEALKIIRKIFPFIDEHSAKKDQKEFYRQLGLTPESVVEYKNNIKHIKLFFEGKKKLLLSSLKKEMMVYAKNQEFEKAEEIKRKIFALQHINDIALIKEETTQKYQNSSRFTPEGSYTDKNFGISAIFRVEAYDVAHMSGKNMVGVMTVIENGEVIKSEYKKFNIKTQSGANDTGALEEILSRRFRHTEWGMPDLVVVDGGEAQLNVARRVLKRYQLNISLVSVLKDERHKPKAILGDEVKAKKYKSEILLSNSEAHRFAITFHKKKRAKNFLK